MKESRVEHFFLSLITISLLVPLVGTADFTDRDETASSNVSACGDCHQSPQLGGSSPTTVTRAGQDYKALSQNLGHENVLTTFTSSGEVSCEPKGKSCEDSAQESRAPNWILRTL